MENGGLSMEEVARTANEDDPNQCLMRTNRHPHPPAAAGSYVTEN